MDSIQRALSRKERLDYLANNPDEALRRKQLAKLKRLGLDPKLISEDMKCNPDELDKLIKANAHRSFGRGRPPTKLTFDEMVERFNGNR